MIPFTDLGAQQKRLRPLLDKAIAKVLDHGQYILGPEVSELEDKLAEFSGAPYVVGCSSGTDALLLALMAINTGPNDAVFVPAFTFVATAEAPAFLGATVFFLDVEKESYNLDPKYFEAAILEAKQKGLSPKAIIPVDLFGLPANYEAIMPIAKKHDVFVLSDCAQSFGASVDNRYAGAFGDAAATSFFPAKPLGCYGDGGAVFCHTEDFYRELLSLRVHGETKRYHSTKIGMTGRLDSIQAAILLVKLTIFKQEIAMRNKVAQNYHEAFADKFSVQNIPENASSVWAQYSILAADSDMRAQIQKKCADNDIPTTIYYPKPLSAQGIFNQYPVIESGIPNALYLCERIFSLPMHPYLDETVQNKIIETVCSAID